MSVSVATPPLNTFCQPLVIVVSIALPPPLTWLDPPFNGGVDGRATTGNELEAIINNGAAGYTAIVESLEPGINSGAGSTATTGNLAWIRH